MWVLIHGDDMVDPTVIGPFETKLIAEDYGQIVLGDTDWVVKQITAPDPI